LRNYIGSVAADSSGGIVAAVAPKGRLVTFRLGVTPSLQFLGCTL
jgi:hypothetical protein